jgi:hypothetical protein
MGKASSNKKVARAAGTGGGRTGSSNTPWAYVGLIALICIAGVALTYTSRNRFEQQKNTPAASSVAPKVGGTAWNEGLAVYLCGAYQAPIKKATTTTGLDPDGNGVIHIAPKVKSVAGTKATLGAFAKSVNMTLTSDSIQLPGGKKYTNGDKCDGQAAKLYVKQYPYVGAANGTLETTSAPDVRLANSVVVTIAFVAPSKKDAIPSAPQSVQSALKAIVTPPTTTTTTTVPASTTTTTPSSSTTAKSSSSTTAKSSSTTTAKAGSTSTTTAKPATKNKKGATTSPTTTKPASTTTTS